MAPNGTLGYDAFISESIPIAVERAAAQRRAPECPRRCRPH